MASPSTNPCVQISPLLSMLRGLVEARSSASSEVGGQLTGPKRVVMVWAARHKAEFTILDESVLAAARCGVSVDACCCNDVRF